MNQTRLHSLRSSFFFWGIILPIPISIAVSFAILYAASRFDIKIIPFWVAKILAVITPYIREFFPEIDKYLDAYYGLFALGVLAIPMLLATWVWKIRYITTYCGHKGEYVRLQKAYVRAKKSARKSSTKPYKWLPVFPLSAPYWDKMEKTFAKLQFKSYNSLDAVVDNALEAIRDEMPGLLYMRGDKHSASGTGSKVLLIVEEVAQSKDELAIVAVVFQKRGQTVNVDVRFSVWPNTIHFKTPRRRIYAESGLGFYLNWSSLKEECYYSYFSPVSWGFNGERFYPEFQDETISNAESIAMSVINELKS